MFYEKTAAAAALASLGIWLYCGLSQKLQVSRYVIDSDKIPAAFDGFKIVCLSDLHAGRVEGLMEQIEKEKPDAVFCTGDFFDGVQPWNETFGLITQLMKTAPVYFVSGNHEKYRMDWDEIEARLKETGIHVLKNEQTALQRGEEVLWISGIDDPGHIVRDAQGVPRQIASEDRKAALKNALNSLPVQSGFHMVLMHRASCFDEACRDDFDLFFCGHLHGGQWRIGQTGIAGPGNEKRVDLFPKYSSGLYQKGNTRMIVSRGLSDQMVIPRFYNRPDLVSVQLKSTKCT
ncbi:MAG: metallophosphoesterase [Erysipelotrichaceae bacterium]|nr:metallophosphoesterase [Erysipelotrichaceae bacterium]